MNTKIEGNIGEQLACNYLASEGYRILERNLLCKGGEIDIIAFKDNTIVFVEVKSRSNNNFGSGLESVNYSKQKCIVKSAKQYIHHKKLYGRNIRFDIISVNNGEIEHITDAFWAN